MSKSIAEKIAEYVREAGGRAFYVGGFVRDRLLGIDNKDVDFHGWTPEDVKRVAYEHLDGYDFQSYIPCITQGGPGSTFSGTYVELCKYIDQYNCEQFGFTQQEIEDARLPLQVIFG